MNVFSKEFSSTQGFTKISDRPTIEIKAVKPLSIGFEVQYTSTMINQVVMCKRIIKADDLKVFVLTYECPATSNNEEIIKHYILNN